MGQLRQDAQPGWDAAQAATPVARTAPATVATAAAAAPTPTTPVSISKIEVFPGRLRFYTRIADGASRFTTREMAERACAAYPNLPAHSCINSKGPTFGDVMAKTSIPHLLEHLVIAEQVAIAGRRGRDATFVGTTEWADPSRIEAITEVSFVDDLEALEALNRALSFLNSVQ